MTVGRCYSLAAGDQRHQFLVTCATTQGRSRHGRELPSQRASERGSGGTQDMGHRVIYLFSGNSIMDITAHHLPFILWLRSESLGPAHTQRDEEMTQSHENQRVPSIGGIELTYEALCSYVFKAWYKIWLNTSLPLRLRTSP